MLIMTIKRYWKTRSLKIIIITLGVIMKVITILIKTITK